MLYNDFRYYLFRNLDLVSQMSYAKKIYSFLFTLNFEYPDFKKWYISLYNNNNTLKDNRDIILCTINESIAGVAILKRDTYEKKICTLRVAPMYQHHGIGSYLLEKSLELFNYEKPLITIHISKYRDFQKLFERYGFKLEQQLQGYYGLLRSELAYNGILSNQFIERNSIIEHLAFNVEKNIYNYPFSNKKIFIANTFTPIIE